MSGEFSLGTVQVSSTREERFTEYVRSRGMRCTRQRQIVLKYVFKQHDHFDVDTLISRMPRKGKPSYVSRPTVYRTLNEFVDAGLLRRFVLAGRAVYEHDYGYPQHDHLYCQQCLQLIEFRSDRLEALREAVAEEHGFRVTGHRLIINGICAECS